MKTKDIVKNIDNPDGFSKVPVNLKKDSEGIIPIHCKMQIAIWIETKSSIICAISSDFTTLCVNELTKIIQDIKYGAIIEM